MRHTKKVEGRATAHLTTLTTAELNRAGPWCVPLPVLSGGGMRQATPRGMEQPNVLLSHIDMKHATKHTFSGMGSSGVEFFSSGHRDHAEVTFRDTESGDSVVVEGLRTVYLQGAIRNYVRTLGYRDEDKNAREFLETLQGELAKALKKEEA